MDASVISIVSEVWVMGNIEGSGVEPQSDRELLTQADSGEKTEPMRKALESMASN